MKATTLILAVVCAVGFTSCCCQSQSMPALRPMPTCDSAVTPPPVTSIPVNEGK